MQPEERMGDDEELRFIMQKIYPLGILNKAAKIKVAKSVKEILRMVSEKAA